MRILDLGPGTNSDGIDNDLDAGVVDDVNEVVNEVSYGL